VSSISKKFAQALYLLSVIQGELEHRRCKCFYPRVHKGLFASGIAREVCREHILQFTAKNHCLVVERPSRKKQKTILCRSFSIPFSESEGLPPGLPDQHYQMSHETRHSHDISRMLGDHYDDPACNVGSVTSRNCLQVTYCRISEFHPQPQRLCSL